MKLQPTVNVQNSKYSLFGIVARLPFISFSSFRIKFIDSIYQGLPLKETLKTKKHYKTQHSIYSLFLWSLPLYKPFPSYHIPSSSVSLPFSFCITYSSSYLLYYLERAAMSRPGDWNCRSCQHLNFQRRDSCQRCGDSKYGDREDFGGFGGRGGSSFGFSSGSDVRPGDWYCGAANCGTHNFASRSSCFKCGAFKDDFAAAGSGSGFNYNTDISRSRGSFGGGGRPGWKSGDWICNRFGCNEHNFASRMECFKCCAPRDMY